MKISSSKFDTEHDAPWADLIDERDVIDAINDLSDWQPEAADRHDAALDDLEGIAVRGRMLIAEQYRVIGEVLRQAEETPEPWVGADPTLEPDWDDPRERGVGAVRRERRDFAVRAAAADIAVRLRMSEVAVRARAGHAETLRERCARVWAAFLGGRVQEANAVAAAQLAASLPHDDRGSWAAFDAQVVEASERLTPAKFRVRARAVRERVHAESLDERHRRAVADRGVWLTPELDGMSSLSILAPAADAQVAIGRVDRIARHLHGQNGEERTLAQLRADVLIDLLTIGTTADTPRVNRPSVAITVPVMTLLGESDEPATLEGYGPIDIDTAKRLAGEATSWIRVLTHPITATVLDVDRTTYRVPNALRRWLGVTNPTCAFPGCGRSARECDIDHLIDWQFGGKTSAANLAPECEPHHRVRHGSLWKIERDPATGALLWTSPTGYNSDGDPPPF